MKVGPGRFGGGELATLFCGTLLPDVSDMMMVVEGDLLPEFGADTPWQR